MIELVVDYFPCGRCDFSLVLKTLAMTRSIMFGNTNEDETELVFNFRLLDCCEKRYLLG